MGAANDAADVQDARLRSLPIPFLEVEGQVLEASRRAEPVDDAVPYRCFLVLTSCAHRAHVASCRGCRPARPVERVDHVAHGIGASELSTCNRDELHVGLLGDFFDVGDDARAADLAELVFECNEQGVLGAERADVSQVA